MPDFFEYVHECSYIYYDLKSPADEIVKSLEIKQINYIDEISKILLNNIFFNNQSTLCLHFLLSRFGLNLSKYTNSFKNNYYVFKGLTPPLELNATKIINNLSNLDKYNSNNFDPGLRQQILKLLVTSPLKSSNLFCSKSILDLPDYKQHNDFIQGRLLNFLENHNLN